MFEGEKTWVFWTGLIILALACLGVFSIFWVFAVVSPFNLEYQLRISTPFIVGGIVFIIIGLYMMNSGVKR
jgi:small neutral amino acid transporter SnatA (MarC family)